MRELVYTLLDLERESRKTCDFCYNLYGEDNKSVQQIITRIKSNGRYISDDVVCEECKEKFENDELLKCKRCGRLQNRHDIDVLSSKYICYCIRHNEELEEKKLPTAPYKSQAVYYEEQINSLQEKLNEAEWTIHQEREAHEIFMKNSEKWSKMQKQELLNKIKELETEVERLRAENGQLVTQIEVKKWP